MIKVGVIKDCTGCIQNGVPNDLNASTVLKWSGQKWRPDQTLASIRLDNEPRVGTPLRRYLVQTNFEMDHSKARLLKVRYSVIQYLDSPLYNVCIPAQKYMF